MTTNSTKNKSTINWNKSKKMVGVTRILRTELHLQYHKLFSRDARVFGD